jgi:hypothetical protein
MLPDRPARAPDRYGLAKAIADLLASGAELDAETRGTPSGSARPGSRIFSMDTARTPCPS